LAKNIIEYARKKAISLPYIKGENRMVSVITDKRGKILSIASNDYKKSSPRMLNYSLAVGEEFKQYWHSECRAISKLPYTSKPYKITIVRINKVGNLMLSKPCNICSNIIKNVGIKVIEYSI
jgi:hypothetical protein